MHQIITVCLVASPSSLLHPSIATAPLFAPLFLDRSSNRLHLCRRRQRLWPSHAAVQPPPPPAFLPTPPPLPPRPLAWPVCLVRFSLTLPPPPLLWVLPPSPALPHPPSPNHRASPHSTGCVGGRRKEGRRGGGCRAR
jgi:hypothetical protein